MSHASDHLPLLPSGPDGVHGLSPHGTGHPAKNTRFSSIYDSITLFKWRACRDSNPRPSAPEADTLSS